MSSFNPTTKTQEALQQALQTASANGNPDIRPAHLLAAILEQKDGIAAPVLKATGVDPETVLKEARQLIDALPKAEGANMANPNFNRDALNVLTRAQELAGELGDEYVSTEVLLAAIAGSKTECRGAADLPGCHLRRAQGRFPLRAWCSQGDLGEPRGAVPGSGEVRHGPHRPCPRRQD